MGTKGTKWYAMVCIMGQGEERLFNCNTATRENVQLHLTRLKCTDHEPAKAETVWNGLKKYHCAQLIDVDVVRYDPVINCDLMRFTKLQ